MKDLRFLVTGGAGFIGSHLVDALLASGHAVTALDDLSVGTLDNLRQCVGLAQFRFVSGSVLAEPLVDRLVAEVDAVFHLAAVVGVKYVLDDPLHGMQVNVRGTENVLAAAARHGRRVLVASSSEAYGKSAAVPLRETEVTVLGPSHVPRWSYALAKLLDEQLVFAYHRQRGLPAVAVRYFNAYGPRLDPRGHGSVVARLISQALQQQPMTVYGDGRQTRAFTYVADTVRGTLAALGNDAAFGQVFNIGLAHETSVLELAQRIQKLTGTRSAIVHVPFEQAFGAQFEEATCRLPDTRRTEQRLGFVAEVPLDEGLRRTIQWFGEQDHGHVTA